MTARHHRTTQAAVVVLKPAVLLPLRHRVLPHQTALTVHLNGLQTE